MMQCCNIERTQQNRGSNVSGTWLSGCLYWFSVVVVFTGSSTLSNVPPQTCWEHWSPALSSSSTQNFDSNEDENIHKNLFSLSIFTSKLHESLMSSTVEQPVERGVHVEDTHTRPWTVPPAQAPGGPTTTEEQHFLSLMRLIWMMLACCFLHMLLCF